MMNLMIDEGHVTFKELNCNPRCYIVVPNATSQIEK